MSGSAPALRRKPDLFFLVAGLASSLLCMSAILSFAFLLPVQMAYGRRGGRGGLAAAGDLGGCRLAIHEVISFGAAKTRFRVVLAYSAACS